ncbi:PAAR repeat-containing protein [Vibrio phage BONAISHI]|nr:PAAR repeat-containing protein [Vibrio phage BONAISHI]
MGQPASRGPEGTTGHGCWPPTIINGNASTVFINSMPAMKVGAPTIPHTCVVPKHPTHGSALVGGSGTVFVEKIPLGRIGDPIGCGEAIASGSSNVFAG